MQVVGVPRAAPPERRTIYEQHVSATDAALRQRIHHLGVHIPCGRIRGPVGGFGPRLWQSCSCEDYPLRWPTGDISEDRALCIICFRGTAGGPSRWAWLACNECRISNERIRARTGVRPFALGRHSLMNGIGVPGGAPPEIVSEETARLIEFARGDGRLKAWKVREYGRLSAAFDPLADVPLREWQQQWPPSHSASADAFSRVLETHPDA